MAYVVTCKGSVVAGPFGYLSDANNARDAKIRESGISSGYFKVEYRP